MYVNMEICEKQAYMYIESNSSRRNFIKKCGSSILLWKNRK